MKRGEDEEDELVPVGGFDTKTVVREGALEKQSPGMALKRWQTRHFTLTPSALFYRKKKSTEATLGAIKLGHIKSCAARQQAAGGGKGATKRVVFEVVTSNRVYALAADSEASARLWIDAINRERVSSASTIPTSSSPSPPLSPSTSSSSTATATEGDWIAGEKVLHASPTAGPEDVFYTHHSLRDGRWAKFTMTTYRLIFTHKDGLESVPLGLAMRVEPARHEERNLAGFVIECKDFRTLFMFFLYPEPIKALTNLFKQHICPQQIFHLFAYQNKEKFATAAPQDSAGFTMYNLEREFKRLRIPSKQWRITSINKNFAFPQFPNQFIVPAAISDETIFQLWNSLQKWQRWTLALAWRNPTTGACLLRSFKFLLGGENMAVSESDWISELGKAKRGHRSMLQYVLLIQPQAETLHVFDTSRIKLKAGADASAAVKIEPAQNVKTFTTDEGQIMTRKTELLPPAAVEDSLNKLAQLVSSFDAHAFAAHKEKATQWRESVEATRWLTGIRRLFEATAKVVTQLQLGNPVVVLNHDGSEAVPQVVSLAQLCLDPHYRTIAGLCLLIEKEWMAFCFQWGQGNKAKYLPKQYSYLFVQFIDAVWQLWTQSPAQFEFSPHLLVFLLDSVYSCRFGSFLTNTHRDRLKKKFGILNKTGSVWAYITSHQSEFVNSLYDPNSHKTSPRLAIHPSQVTLWTEYYLRWATAAANEQITKEIAIQLAKQQQAKSESVGLDISNHALTRLPAPLIDRLPLLASLDLSSNFISSVAAHLPHFSGLESLDLSHNLITSFSTRPQDHNATAAAAATDDNGQQRSPDASPGGSFERLDRLHLADNRLWVVDQLPASLTDLNVAHNAIEHLPRHLATLTQLRVLNVAYNKLLTDQGDKGMPEVLLKLTSLTSLNLAGIGMPQLPADFFSALPHLEVLDLSHNQLPTLPADIARATSVRVLNISNNPFTRLPNAILHLNSLEEFYANNVAAEECLRLADLIGMTRLRCLDLRNNQITALPPGCFARWTNMERLWLSHNQLSALQADGIGCLAATLQELHLGHNRLDCMPAEMAKLTRLRVLTVEGNLIVELPAQLGILTQLERLDVGSQNGRLRSPPAEVVALGSASIVAYLGQLLKGQEPCYRLKLMFVGQENVGKTSLLRALNRRERRVKTMIVRQASDLPDPSVAPLSTDGIDINTWSLSMNSVWGPDAAAVDLSAWDFAGQEIYYATHQFFLSERSLFLVVFNLLSPVQSRIEYWLQSVRAAAKGSPILIIGTHAEHERCTEEYLAEMQRRLETKFRYKFPNLVGIHFVSPVQGKGMDALANSLRQVVAKQDYIGRTLPSSYLALEKVVAAQAKVRTPPVLTWHEYRDLAKLCMIEEDNEDLRTATALLHNLGSLVHFANDEKLQDVVILDPQWLMDVLATVVSTKHNYCRTGVLPHSALPHIWRAPAFPRELHGFLLSLLERFEITFPIQSYAHKLDYSPTTAVDIGSSPEDTLSSLVPSLLPEEAPAKLAELWPSRICAGENVFGRTYQFDFVPKGFMGRLMIRLLGFPLAAQVIWRYGMLARIAKEQILVELAPEKDQLKILVRTELRGEQMSNLCWLVFAAVDSLVKEWYNLEARVLVPCPHCMVFSGLDQTPYMFPIEECQQAAMLPNDAFLYCRISDRSSKEPTAVRLDTAAPDLAMVHLDSHKIAFSELDKQEPPIGEGGYATVYKGTYKGEVVAIKQLRPAAVDAFEDTPGGDGGSLDEEAESRRLTYEEFRHEVWIMSTDPHQRISGLAHPNLVAMRGFCTEPACIVTEYVGKGALIEYLESDKPLDWPLRLKIAKDIAKGCAFLHSTSPPVMHRDLKSPNILLADVSPGAEVVAKVCDFGVSLSAAAHTAGRRVDCPVWLAPEVMADKIYTVKADVYSIGVILWELLTRKAFFGEIRFMSLLEDKVKSGERPPIPDDCVPAYRRLIEDCWAQDPDARPSCAVIAERLTEIMHQVCPEASGYDSQVDNKYKAQRKAEAEEKRKALIALRQKISENRLARRTAPVSMMVSSESKKSLLSQCIKDVAQLDECSKKDIVVFMEQFLRQRRNHLIGAGVGDDDDGKVVQAAGASGSAQSAKAEERRWIEEFLQQLEAEKKRAHEDEVAALMAQAQQLERPPSRNSNSPDKAGGAVSRLERSTTVAVAVAHSSQPSIRGLQD